MMGQVPGQSAAAPTLAQQLRTDTRALHTEVERTGVMRELLRGQLGRTGYCALLRNLHAIYAALEPALQRHANHPAVAPVVFEALFREAPLASDLRDLHGADWADALPLQPSTQRYVARLHHIGEHAPALLVAHAYLRTLGDLSGGQMLAKIVTRSLRLDAGRGIQFYDFGSPFDVAAHLQTFRSGLDALPLAPGDQQAIVIEACSAFRMHAELFTELAPQGIASGSAALSADQP